MNELTSTEKGGPRYQPEVWHAVCAICFDAIPFCATPDMRPCSNRGERRTATLCEACCGAMNIVLRDGGKAIDHRISIGQKWVC